MSPTVEARPRVHRSRRVFAPAVAIVTLGLVVGAAHSVLQPVTLRMRDAGPTIIRVPGGDAQAGAPGGSQEPENAPDGVTGDPGGAGAPGDDPGVLTLGRFLTLDQTRLLWNYTEQPVAFVDARHREEYVAGHIPRAHLFDPEGRARGVLPDWLDYYIPDSTIVVVYCEGGSCTDSENAARDLQMLGFTSVHIFHDGFPAWKAAGLDVETGDPAGGGL